MTLKTNKKGFTLVELLVVISILSVMGVGAIVGFGNMGDQFATRQAASVIGDFMTQLEAEILMGKYEKSTLYFQPDYLMAISEPKGSQAILKWIPEKDEICGQNQHNLANFEAGNLLIKNEQGNVLKIKAMVDDTFKCLDFKASDDLQWQVQLRNDEAYSPVIRWVRFHFDPEKKRGLVLNAKNARLELQGPYASRRLYHKEIL